MGTTSLVIGIGLIVSGFAFLFFTPNNSSPMSDWGELVVDIITYLIIGIPVIALGAFFLRKYDKEKKKNVEVL